MVRGKKVKGSITVEAVFIFPIILFIILAFIYFAFYLHDRMVINTVMNEANERLNQSVKQPTDYTSGAIYYDKMTSRTLLCRYNGDYSVEIEAAKKYIKEQLSKKLMIGKVRNIEITKNKHSIATKVAAESQISLLPSRVYLSKYQKSVSIAQCEVNNASEYVRAADVSLDVLSQTKGFDKIVKVIDKIDHIVK